MKSHETRRCQQKESSYLCPPTTLIIPVSVLAYVCCVLFFNLFGICVLVLGVAILLLGKIFWIVYNAGAVVPEVKFCLSQAFYHETSSWVFQIFVTSL